MNELEKDSIIQAIQHAKGSFQDPITSFNEQFISKYGGLEIKRLSQERVSLLNKIEDLGPRWTWSDVQRLQASSLNKKIRQNKRKIRLLKGLHGTSKLTRAKTSFRTHDITFDNRWTQRSWIPGDPKDRNIFHLFD